jgi:hypothetical protein
MARSSRRRDWDDEDNDDFENDDDRPRRPRKKKGKSGVPVPLIVAGVTGIGLVLLVGIVVAAWLLLGDSSAGKKPVAPVAAGGDDGGFNIEINPAVKPETQPWQRLTPAEHGITLLVPGTPAPIDDDRLSFFQSGKKKAKGWVCKGTANQYYLIQADGLGDEAEVRKWLPNMMATYLGLGGMSEPTTAVTIDGQPGQQYEPVKGFGFAGVFVYRTLQIDGRTYIFGVNSKPDDPAVQKFFASVKVARGPDGKPRGG